MEILRMIHGKTQIVSFFIFFSAKNLSLWIIFNVKNVYNFDFIKLLYVDNGGKIFLFFCEYEHTENLKYLAYQ